MNRKRGFALMSAVIIMTIVVAFSMLLFSFILQTKSYAKFSTTTLNNKIKFQKIYADFLDNEQIDEIYDDDVKIYTSDENSKIKALVVKSKNAKTAQISFLAVYDFSQNQNLAKQNQNFYLTIKNFNGVNYYYLADIVRYEKVN